MQGTSGQATFWLFEKRLAALVSLFCLPLLFLPKVNLLRFSGETAGLRIDDLLLSLLFFFVCYAKIGLRSPSSEPERGIFFLTGYSLFSFLLSRALYAGGLLQHGSNLFYCLRPLEYFLFFYLGLFASSLIRPEFLLRALSFWMIALMAAQKLHLAGAIGHSGYVPDVSNRLFGLASFPAEAGLLLNMLFCCLLFGGAEREGRLQKSWRALALFASFGAMTVLTGARIAIAAQLLLFASFFIADRRSSRLLLLCTAPPLLFFIWLLITQTELYERSGQLFSRANFELFFGIWKRIDPYRHLMSASLAQAGDHDLSWYIRLHRWLIASKIYLYHPECWLFGLGPGFTGPALDGGLLRMFVEYGLLGTLLFWRLFRALWQISPLLKWLLAAFMINMLFFDAYLAYKPMSLLFFIAGAESRAGRRERADPPLEESAL